MTPFERAGDLRLRNYARALDAEPGEFRVLRRLPRADEFWLAPGRPDITIGVVDVETTGLADDDAIVELALVKMSLADGQLTAMGEPISMLEDPGVPLSQDIARLTGLTDADLAGQAFDEWELAGLLRDVDVLVAFNAAFDAPRLRRRFDWMIQPWCCALRDFDWAAAGWEGRTQHALLGHAGMFYNAHRAATDTAALAVLLALTAPDGRTIAANIVDRGQRKTVRIAAHGAPFALKTALRARGYRWHSGAREWAIDVEQDAADEEERSLRRLSSLIRPTLQQLDWHERHSR